MPRSIQHIERNARKIASKQARRKRTYRLKALAGATKWACANGADPISDCLSGAAVAMPVGTEDRTHSNNVGGS